MASGTSSLESNGSNESISHSYVSNERHNPTQLPTIPIPIDYEVLSNNQCNYTVKPHGAHVMSGPYEHQQYDVINKQTNESLKQQCEKALHDLNQLRRQHTETSRRCEHVMKYPDALGNLHDAYVNLKKLVDVLKELGLMSLSSTLARKTRYVVELRIPPPVEEEEID